MKVDGLRDDLRHFNRSCAASKIDPRREFCCRPDTNGGGMAFTFVFRRHAPFATFGLEFEGDHRTGPSMSLAATARTLGCVPVLQFSFATLMSAIVAR